MTATFMCAVSAQASASCKAEKVSRNLLKLTVNEAKSAVARPWERKFLGSSVTAQQSSKVRIAKQSIHCLKPSKSSAGVDELLQPLPKPRAHRRT